MKIKNTQSKDNLNYRWVPQTLGRSTSIL